VVSQWLGSLAEPTVQEWQILVKAREENGLSIYPGFGDLYGNLAWFDLLHDQCAQVAEWLGSDDGETRRFALGLLGVPCMKQQRAEAVVALLEPYVADEEWLSILNRFFWQAKKLDGALLTLYRKVVRTSALLKGKDAPLDFPHDLFESQPETAVAILATWFDAASELARSHGKSNPFEYMGNMRHGDYDLKRIPARGAEPFFQEFLPRLCSVAKANAVEDSEGVLQDDVWRYKSLWENHEDIHDVFLECVMSTGRQLAEANPERVHQLTAPLAVEPHHTIAFILLRVWSANGQHFAEAIAAYLLAHPMHLELGYAFGAAGDGTTSLGVARAAIRVAVPYLNDAVFASLQTAVRRVAPGWESGKDARGSRGHSEYLLLTSMPKDRLSAPNRRRLAELSRKFASIDTRLPTLNTGMSVVGPPIGADGIRNMTDDQWVHAMLKYCDENPGWGRRGPRGGVHQLSQCLRERAREEKERFGELCLRMPDKAHASYFSAILNGITNQNVQGSDRANSNELPVETIEAVIQRIHRLPGNPCGRSVCGAIERSAKMLFCPETLEVLSHYATGSEEEVEDRDDLYQQGINTIRGNAADAIGNLLFENPAQLPHLESAIGSLIQDPSSAVRSCAVRPLLAVLNIDRDRAVSLFLTCISTAATGILKTPPTLHFLYYALSTHYQEIRQILIDMLSSEDAELRTHAGRLITLSRLGNESAEPEFQRVLGGCESARKGAASVFEANLAGDHGEFCKTHLLRCFEDDSEEVRKEAVSFLGRTDFSLATYEDIIGRLVESRAFPEGADSLSRAAGKGTARLPDMVADALAKAVDLLERPGNEHSRIGHVIPELVMRMYHQSQSREARNRCLDIIDRLARLQAYGIEEQLAEFER